MSLNNKESLREGTNIKRSTSPIRKYFSTKPSSTTTTTTTKVTTSAPIKKPLTSPNDNIEKNTTKLETPKDTDSKTKPSLQQMSFYDFNLKYQRKANATAPSTPTNEIRPPTLKRSHSAISHLDTANETWMNSPLISKQKTYDNKTVSCISSAALDVVCSHTHSLYIVRSTCATYHRHAFCSSDDEQISTNRLHIGQPRI